MKVVSFNANGIRAAQRKGFFEWLDKERPDFLCIQDTKAHENQLSPEFFPKHYHTHFVNAEKKGYSGVAIYALEKPQQITTTLNQPYFDKEARYLRFDYDDFSVISLYLPSGTSGEERQAIKYQLMDFFEQHMLELLASNKPVIICGDWNIAHTQKDIKNWRGNQKNSGFLPEERAWLDKLFNDIGFVDAFRVLNQEEDQYTWWSQRGQARAKNVGWRIDYQIITPNLKDKIQSVAIYNDEKLSDHAPLIIEYAI